MRDLCRLLSRKRLRDDLGAVDEVEEGVGQFRIEELFPTLVRLFAQRSALTFQKD